MPNQFPKTRPQTEIPSPRKNIMLGLLGLSVSGVIYGVSFWGLLLILREQQIIESIISYRYCVAIVYVFLLVRIYDKAIFGKK